MRGTIDSTAIISSEARLADDVEVGPYSIIGPGVVIGAGTTIGPHSRIDGPTTIGERNRFTGQFSAGTPPQDLKYKGEKTELRIGNDTTFREFVTLNRGTAGGGGITSIGNSNFFMAYSHVAHDCHVGSNTIFANNATLAGHVEVGDFATVGAFSAVHQFCRVGRDAFIGGASIIVKDALPFSRCQGNHARCFGENSVGLRRKGFSDDDVRRLHRAFRLLLAARLNTTQALDAIRADAALVADPNVAYLVAFIESSQRGVIKK